jgi:hypothetical protein
VSPEGSVQSVVSRSDLARFIDQLADSLVVEPDTWENGSLESFLRAWSAWLSDMDGYFINRGQAIPESPSWKLIAEMLLASRVYE